MLDDDEVAEWVVFCVFFVGFLIGMAIGFYVGREMPKPMKPDGFCQVKEIDNHDERLSF